MNGNGSEDCRVFRLSPRRRALLIGIGCAVVLPLMIEAIASGDPGIGLIAFIVAVMLAGIFGLAGWAYPKLRVCSQDISRHDIGYTGTH